MKRLSLATQVTLIVVIALLVAQGVSVAIALDNRRDQMTERAVRPAAERIALLIADPERLERRSRMAERFTDGDRPRFERRRFRRGGGPDGRRGQRRFLDVSETSPIAPDAIRLDDAQRAFRTALSDAGVDGSGARVVRLPPRPSRLRTDPGPPRMLLAVPLDDGRWISLAAPGPDAIAPVLGRLIVLHLLIGLLILVPTLFLLRRVGLAMGRLTASAESFDGQRGSAFVPVEPDGPRDVAALIRSVNDMQARILAMLDEKDVMLGAIGHDLRTPLTALRLEAEGVEDAERRTALVDQVERLHGQLESILELARSDRAIAPGSTVAPLSLLRSVTSRYREAGRSVALHADRDHPFPGDEAAVRRAVRNLIDNALRHANHVDLVLERDPQDRVALLVRDDGPGIPAAERARLKRPFERAESSRNRETGGHGLGLAIVEAIVRRHGGTLVLADRGDGLPGLEARLLFPA
ncbi:HAMP domain-containing sensor histidine kinase [Sphingomicrobium sp. XHP0239]|uniref:sensor histidine kinase n=1 Tax=Sphingomicrobium maritimum TaxID=3133972 RepID=UPI0031CCCD2A